MHHSLDEMEGACVMLAHKMLVPVDGSATSETALPVAEAIAARTGSALALVRAADRNSSSAIDTAEKYVGTLAESLTGRGLQVEWGVPVGPPADWIVEETDLRKATLVVMATHDRTGPDRWLHG